MEIVATIVWDFIVATATTPENVALLALSWIAVEAVAPMMRWVVAFPGWKNPTRVWLHGLFKALKNIAAIGWCLVLCWVPYAQPPLCEGGPADGCQTIIERVTTAAVLGFVLTFGHKFSASLYRRAFGKAKRVKMVCANCRKTGTFESTSDACPHCGQPPHEVTTSR